MNRILLGATVALAMAGCTQQPGMSGDSQSNRQMEVAEIVNLKDDVSPANGWVEVVKGGWQKTDKGHFSFRGTTVEAQEYLLKRTKTELEQLNSLSGMSVQDKSLKEYLQKEVESFERNIKSLKNNTSEFKALVACSANATATYTSGTYGAKATASANCNGVVVEANAYSSSNQGNDGGTDRGLDSAFKSAVSYGTTGCSSRASAKAGPESDFDSFTGCYGLF